MSFVIRQIARRADGGDIVRTRSIAAAEISIGRGTDCDIQLADLGIMLRHARLTQLADGRVAAEALGGIPLEIDGKFLSRAEFALGQPVAIAMASHRLTLSAGPGNSIAITAERVIAASDAADADAETDIFSLRGVMPSKRATAWATLAIVLLAFLAWPLWTFMARDTELPREMVTAAATVSNAKPAAIPAKGAFAGDMLWTSGPLSSAHAGLANNCGACHQQAFVSVTDSACAACHKPDVLPDHAAAPRMDRGRVQATGFTADLHQGLNLPVGRCASCHKEHEGPDGALLVAQSFCTDCHAGLSARLTDTKLTNVPDWGDHPQFRATIVRQPSASAPVFQRVSLATKPQENSGLIYPHDLHMSRTNSVANMVRKQGLAAKDGALACNYCHVADADGVRFKPMEMEKACGDCHDLAFARDGDTLRTLPHGKPQQVAGIIRDFYLSQAFSPRPQVQRLAFERRQPGRMAELDAAALRITGPGTARARADAAITAIFSRDGVCADCHRVIDTGATNRALRYDIAPVTLASHYLPKGQFPHKQHKSYDNKTGDAACVACHTGVPKSNRASDVLLPPVAQCKDCHGAARVTDAKASCDTCHGFHQGDGAPAAAPVKPRVIAFGQTSLPG